MFLFEVVWSCKLLFQFLVFTVNTGFTGKGFFFTVLPAKENITGNVTPIVTVFYRYRLLPQPYLQMSNADGRPTTLHQ